MQKKIGYVLPFFIFLFLFFLKPVNASETLDYNEILADSFIANQSYINTNFGTLNNFKMMATVSYIARPYMLWNVSSLPENITITNAYLYAYLTAEPTSPNTFNALVYNTTLAYNETNITWATAPTGNVLISNQSINGTVGWKSFNVTDAIKHSYDANEYMSIMLRWDNETASNNKSFFFWSREYASTSLRPYITVDYTIDDCNTVCGDCGCNIEGTGCNYPQALTDVSADSGAFALDDGTNNIYCYPDKTCANDVVFECPSGTTATQITPEYNFSGTDIWSSENNTNWCAGCIFVNFYNPLKSAWTILLTNCFKEGVSVLPVVVSPINDASIKYECECNGQYCADMYTTNVENVTTSIIPEWTAGCWNDVQAKYYNIMNSSCSNTTVANLVSKYVTNATAVNNTRYMCDKINSTTQCYDTNCNPVSCQNLVGASCEESAGGQAALAVGGMMGITDCGLSQNIIALLGSLIVGCFVLYYTRDSNQSAMAFIVGTLATLVMFTLVSWFPAWVIIILIVISSYIVAKSLGIGGGV